MKTYTTHSNLEITAEQLLTQARTDLNEMTNSADGTQMHRRAVVGKSLYVCLHGCRRPEGFWAVSIRVTGQYVDRAWVPMRTKSDAAELGAEIESLLALQPIGLAA